MTINAEVQKLETDNVVTLFRLDTSPIGGTTVFNFTKKMRDGASISFGGVPYYGIDVDASGFLWDGRGNFPTPKLQVSNVANLLTAAIADRGDLVGATLTRIRTFEQFLDDGATPDSAAIFPLDIYTVQQKTKHNKVFIEWSLSSILDQTGRQIPARTMLRDVCSFSYRLYNPATGTFDTSTAKCPYSGSIYFDENNDLQTNPALDKCNKRLTGCKARFGEFNQLPFSGFPGIAKVRGV